MTNYHIGLLGTTSVHAWAAENFRNNAVVKSLIAARCNSRTALLTLPALRGDFVITDHTEQPLVHCRRNGTRLLKLTFNCVSARLKLLCFSL